MVEVYHAKQMHIDVYVVPDYIRCSEYDWRFLAMSLPVTTLKAHVALNVKNVDRSIDFYRQLFGIEPIRIRPGYAKFDVQNPPLNISLNESAAFGPGALSHLGIQVSSTEEVLAVRRQWRETGLVTRDEMQTNCCFAMQDKTWVQDPDGNQWEVFVVLQNNLAESASCCGTSAEQALVNIEQR